MKIVLVGSGNVAHHLGLALYGQGHQVVQVYGRTPANAQELADSLSSTVITGLEELDLDADLYVVAVSDQAIPSVIEQIPSTIQGIVVHTSGATDLSVLSKFKNPGVIYPPQSLTKGVKTDISAIPFGIEASDENTFETLMELAKAISTKSFPCTSQQRLALHTAAMFANNFPNALFQIAYDILNRENLSFDLVRPLIVETANKAQNHQPIDVQTGPAIRNDQTTITKHEDYLKQDADWWSIYRLITGYIQGK